jgi:hypothetical protein
VRRVAGFDLALSAAYKWNTDARQAGGSRRLEFAASASRRFGGLTPRISLVYSPDDLGGTGASLYAEAGAAVTLFAGASLSANAARRERDNGDPIIPPSTPARATRSPAILARTCAITTPRKAASARSTSRGWWPRPGCNF